MKKKKKILVFLCSKFSSQLFVSVFVSVSVPIPIIVTKVNCCMVRYAEGHLFEGLGQQQC